MLALVACSALLAIGLDAPPPADSQQSYQEARAKAGRSPEEQVRLALWCEAHGLSAQRLHHLTLAVLADPKNLTARGLMGLVLHEGRWLRPEVLADKLKADPEKAATLAEYQSRRLKADYKADAQYALGIWCDEHGLKEQAKAHLTAVTRLDPKRDNAWKKLGYKKHEGRWVTDDQLAAEKADVEAQKQADRKWKPLLEKYKAMLDQPSKREEAEAALASVTDPRAVPSIGLVFARSESSQPRAAQLLGQIDAPSASKGLAFLAVFARSAEARRSAAETLRGRDAREYADLLIALIRDPIKYEVKPVGGPGSPGVLYVEGPKANLQRLYSPPPTFRPGDTLKIDPSGLTVVDRPLNYDQTYFPNVTGHSRYFAQSVGYMDQYGIWATPSGGGGSAFPTPGQGSAGMPVGAVSSPGFVPLQAYVAAMRQAVATGNPRSLSPPSLTQPGHAQAGQVFNPQLQQALGFEHILASPYHDYRYDVDIPLAQVVTESQKTALAAQEQLKADTQMIEKVNRKVRERNDEVVGVLNKATGQSLDPDRQKWTKWWVSEIGYALITGQTAEKPTIVEEVPLTYQPQLNPINQSVQVISYGRMSCFGAGTPVRTIDGVRSIESLQVGDLVLTQSTSSGALGYKPILVVHHNPPSPTFRIQLKGESIISSHFHRFWIAGRGWVMARELKVGEPVRTLGGVVPVEAVEADKVQPVFNLDVADDADFFAGQLGALVHDNTLPDPRLAPFDVAPKSAPVAVARSAED
jgi:Pretoxin HINT domain